MQIYGYCRISTPRQNIERQVRNIAAAYPTAHIVREVYTGTACQGRRELDKLLHCVQPGDTIVFDSVSRMSRSADEGCALYEELYGRGVTLCFLKEPHINTDTYKQALQRQVSAAPSTGSAATDRFVSGVMEALNRYTADLAAEQIRLAFAQAQKEVDDLHQRGPAERQTDRPAAGAQTAYQKSGHGKSADSEAQPGFWRHAERCRLHQADRHCAQYLL